MHILIAARNIPIITQATNGSSTQQALPKKDRSIEARFEYTKYQGVPSMQ